MITSAAKTILATLSVDVLSRHITTLP